MLSHGFGTAVAIEPEPENFRVLRLNVLLNDLEDRIKALPLAVSNEVGRSELVVTRTGAASTGSSPTAASSSARTRAP